MPQDLNYRKFVKVSAVLFVALEIILFPMIQIPPADISAAASYVAISLVALFAAVIFRGEQDGHFIRLGILFTLFADFFLVLLDDRLLEGVLCFIVVQGCYFIYLLVREDRTFVRRLNVYSRIALSLILVIATFLVLGMDTDALAVASVIYYGNLILNMVFAFLRFREEKLFAIGLALFAMCDLCIGLDVLFSSYLNSDVLSAIFSFPYMNVSWVFYQPSQVLIGLRLAQKANCNA